MYPFKFSVILHLTIFFNVFFTKLGQSLPDVDWTTKLKLEHGYETKWVTTDKEFITMEIKAPISGWVAVGFTDNGAMKGADILMGWVDGSGKAYIKDLHGVGNEIPVEDTSQDVELLGGESSDGFTIIRFRRKWNTCDKNDFVIGDQTVKLIWAYGKQATTDLTFDPKYHESNRGIKLVNLRLEAMHSKLPESMNPPDPDIKYFDILMDNLSPFDRLVAKYNLKDVKLPGLDSTEYICKLFQYPNFDRKAQIIGWRPLLQQENLALVHHMVIYECIVPKGNSHKVFKQNVGRAEHCYSTNMPPEWLGYCWNQPIVWNIGGEGDMFPNHTGMPLGEAHGGSTYFMIETHYDNPEKIPFTDNSGLRIYYTEDPRPQDLATLFIGKRFSSFHFVAPGTVGFQSYGGCSSECTKKSIPLEGIFATHVKFHGHRTAKKIFLRHIRNGIELPLIGGDTNYDNNYQQAHLIDPPLQILPGDELLTYCWYDSTERDLPLLAGITTNNSEMCMSFLTYYPKMKLTTCQYQTEYNDFLNAIGIKKLEGEVLSIVSIPFKPKRTDTLDPADETFILLQENRSINLFSQLTIGDKGENYKKNFWDYLVSLDWKGNDAQLSKALNNKLDRTRNYAYCTGDAHIRIPLSKFIVDPPKYKEYIDPASIQCGNQR